MTEPDVTYEVDGHVGVITLNRPDVHNALRRRTYDDRQIRTFDDGFLVQYTCTVVLHDGTKRALSACSVGTVHDGKIVHLAEYLDSSKFGAPR